jgi:hypothetical protein
MEAARSVMLEMEWGHTSMYVLVAGLRSRVSMATQALSALALLAVLGSACGGEGDTTVSTHGRPDAGTSSTGQAGTAASARRCESVQVDGDVVIEHEKDFTARYRVGEPYTKTIMLFGGEPVDADNVLSNAYIIGLDKMDALELAQMYPDFYLCSSPGGQQAAMRIVSYDILPASCDVHDRLVAALRQYDVNAAAGKDRTSIRFEGAQLELESVTADATGEDVTTQASNQDFQLMTSIEQLTGESVLSFGTTN